MFTIEINGTDAKSIETRLSEMQKRLWHFGQYELRPIMDAWQRNDMHRKRPFTGRKGRRGVFTVIRPHSWWEMKREHQGQVRAHRRHIAPPRHWSTRPILREEMKDRLYSEMTAAFNDAIHW